MTISGYNEAQLVEILNEHLSPSKEIVDPDRLIGRETYLTRIRRALLSPGRHVFIYGERGVGKTSLAVTAGQLAIQDDKNFIYVPCGTDTTYFEIIQAIGNSVLDVPERVAGQGQGFNFGLNLPTGGGGNVGYSKDSNSGVSRPVSSAEALDILRFVRSKLSGQIIIAIDEIDRISEARQKIQLAELLKNVSSVIEDMRFIFCGIGADVDEIIGQHLSTGRMFEAVEVEKLSHDKLWRIIDLVAEKLSVNIDRGFLIRIGIISDGFPHFVHLIGECLFYAMHDDNNETKSCEKHHFDTALHEALQKAEPALRKIYQMATEKSKNKAEYEEALWALADRTSTRRQVKEIYDSSYKRIAIERRTSPMLAREKLNSRLLTLRKDSHANIVVGHGSGWFSFRENVVRGYVRLKAESEGIQLVPEAST